MKITLYERKNPIWRIPRLCYGVMRVNKKLMFDYGYAAGYLAGEPIDGDGNPIPWFTYPSVEYLKQLDLRDKSVFEWGSGNSTLFWANKCHDVSSVENDQAWYEKNRSRSKDNMKLFLKVRPNEYVRTITECNKKFGIIVIDGTERLACAHLAPKYLTDDGMIIFDNSDWDVSFELVRFLRDQNLIQVDFSGFSSLNAITSVTSIFFKKDFKFSRIEENQPA